LLATELVLNRAKGVSLPAYFLFGRSVELSLKAYLLACGMPMKELKSREFGHNLSALLREANTRGLPDYVPLESIETGVIELLSYDYMEKRLEYRVTGGTYYLPLIDVTEHVARKLVSGLEAFCTDTKGVQNP
jgi:HEPN domain-containing protein